MTGGETIGGAITSSSEIYVPKPTVITSGGKTQSTVSYVSVSKVTVNTETTAATTAGENEQVPSSIVSVTVCNNDICHPTTVIATLTEVTTSVNGAKLLILLSTQLLQLKPLNLPKSSLLLLVVVITVSPLPLLPLRSWYHCC